VAYVNAEALSRDITFRRKLATSLASAANAIQSEAPSTAYHVQRQLLAQKVAVDPLGWAERFAQCAVQAVAALKTAADAGGTAGPWTVVDADLDSGVSAVWNTFAGVLT